MHTLPELPVDPTSFGDFISKRTFDIHHGKHHKGYVDNLNKLVKDTKFEEESLEQIVSRAPYGVVYDNAAQVWNHTFFWNSLDAKSSEDDISGKLKRLIEKSTYKTVDGIKQAFVDKASKQFGSGWVWLTMSVGELTVKTTSNADTPKRNGDTPLLVCDIWEHAYYLDHQNDRAGFVDMFFKYANWKFASENVENE